jgi:hypothetical protein
LRLLLSSLAGLGLISATGLPPGTEPGHNDVIVLGLNARASAGSIFSALLL